MKKLLIVLGVVLSTAIVALSLNKKTEVKSIQKVDNNQLSVKGYTSDFKGDIANAD